jgi:DNA-directed RNA polymerase subunit omega
MMIYPKLSTLLDKVDSKYSLVVAVSKRARQLVDGQQSLVESDSAKPVSVAIQEISEGKIKCVNIKQIEQSGE